MSSFFAFLKRMRFINRWSLMRNTEIENIQEHSLEVAMVAHNLGAIKNEYFGGNVDINKVAVIAMYHEVSEIFTGDMPTPIKYFDPKLRELYGEVETLAQEKCYQPCQTGYNLFISLYLLMQRLVQNGLSLRLPIQFQPI